MHVVSILIGRPVFDVRHHFLFPGFQLRILVTPVTRSENSFLDQFVRHRFQFRCPAKPCEKVQKTRRKVEVIRSEFGGLVIPPAYVEYSLNSNYFTIGKLECRSQQILTEKHAAPSKKEEGMVNNLSKNRRHKKVFWQLTWKLWKPSPKASKATRRVSTGLIDLKFGTPLIKVPGGCLLSQTYLSYGFIPNMCAAELISHVICSE